METRHFERGLYFLLLKVKENRASIDEALAQLASSMEAEDVESVQGRFKTWIDSEK